MMRLLLIGALLSLSSAWAAEFETAFENSNFTLSVPLEGTGKRELFNYNRFRVTEHIRERGWFVTLIGDIENYLGQNYINSASYQAASAVRSDTPFKTQTSAHDYGEGEVYAQLYRFYGGYADEKQSVVAGLQKISMGVGRIWNPTDLFNPSNPLALEPDEVFGAFGLSYSYAPSDLSELKAIVAQRKDDSAKCAARLKGYLKVADVALDLVSADDALMVGYELEGELFDSGVELRSEGGYFEDKVLDEAFFQAIFGMDYGFEEGLVLAGEWLHSSKRFDLPTLSLPNRGLGDNERLSYNYLGLSGAYEFSMLWRGSLAFIESIDDRSFFLSPLLNYSLGDDMSLTFGAMLYHGSADSEFGDVGNSYYLRWKATF